MKIVIGDKEMEIGKTVVYWCETPKMRGDTTNSATIYAGIVASVVSRTTISVIVQYGNGAHKQVAASEVFLDIEQPIKYLRNVFDNINHNRES